MTTPSHAPHTPVPPAHPTQPSPATRRTPETPVTSPHPHLEGLVTPEAITKSLEMIKSTVEAVHTAMGNCLTPELSRAGIAEMIREERTGKTFDHIAKVAFHVINLFRIATAPDKDEAQEADAAETYIAKNSFQDPSAEPDPLHMSFEDLFYLDALVNSVEHQTGNIFERKAIAVLTDPTAMPEDKAEDISSYLAQEALGGDENKVRAAVRNVAIVLNVIRCEAEKNASEG